MLLLEAYEELEKSTAKLIDKALGKQREEMGADKRRLAFLQGQLDGAKGENQELRVQVRVWEGACVCVCVCRCACVYLRMVCVCIVQHWEDDAKGENQDLRGQVRGVGGCAGGGRLEGGEWASRYTPVQGG